MKLLMKVPMEKVSLLEPFSKCKECRYKDNKCFLCKPFEAPQAFLEQCKQTNRYLYIYVNSKFSRMLLNNNGRSNCKWCKEKNVDRTHLTEVHHKTLADQKRRETQEKIYRIALQQRRTGRWWAMSFLLKQCQMCSFDENGENKTCNLGEFVKDVPRTYNMRCIYSMCLDVDKYIEGYKSYEIAFVIC